MTEQFVVELSLRALDEDRLAPLYLSHQGMLYQPSLALSDHGRAWIGGGWPSNGSPVGDANAPFVSWSISPFCHGGELRGLLQSEEVRNLLDEIYEVRQTALRDEERDASWDAQQAIAELQALLDGCSTVRVSELHEFVGHETTDDVWPSSEPVEAAVAELSKEARLHSWQLEGDLVDALLDKLLSDFAAGRVTCLTGEHRKALLARGGQFVGRMASLEAERAESP